MNRRPTWDNSVRSRLWGWLAWVLCEAAFRIFDVAGWFDNEMTLDDADEYRETFLSRAIALPGGLLYRWGCWCAGRAITWVEVTDE